LCSRGKLRLKARAVHDVVGEKLRAAFEQLGEPLLAVLDAELVVLLHRYPGELAPLPLDFLIPLSLLRLEQFPWIHLWPSARVLPRHPPQGGRQQALRGEAFGRPC
jgi:hypothetical protein